MLYRLIMASLATAAWAAQPSAPSPKAAPLRDLPWAQLNFLHTTDTHGWHGGHLQEPNYSADWGDYISFAHHMRAKADKDGVDLLVVDTGDRIEGNGLYDASDPKGQYTFDIFKHQTIDIICSGNHELYKANSSVNEFLITAPNFKGNYLASNLDIYDNKTEKFVALAPRYRKFTTKNQGIRVIAFGFMFDFFGSANNSRVTPVKETIKQQWFLDTIQDRDVDIFVVAGHVGLRMEEFKLIFQAIRAVQWDTPIQFLGGHTHIRDYAKYDNKAYGIESGRYMETIGFASVGGLTKKKKTTIMRKSPIFNRRYIDNNLYSLHGHTGLNESTFPTELGTNVTKQITKARMALKLDATHGCAPRDLWLNRAVIGSESSIFTWLNRVISDQLASKQKDAKPKLVISNTGALRFDIFKGPFTRDTTYIVAPFTSGFKSLPNIDYPTAAKVLQVLNQNAGVLSQLDPSLDPTLIMPPRVARLDSPMAVDAAMTDDIQVTLTNKEDLTPGYTTKDDLGTDGDDTVHESISYHDVPNCLQTQVDFPKDDKDLEKVDLVYNDFIEPWVLVALQFLGKEADRSTITPYFGGKSLTEFIADWVEKSWPCKETSFLEDL